MKHQFKLKIKPEIKLNSKMKILRFHLRKVVRKQGIKVLLAFFGVCFASLSFASLAQENLELARINSVLNATYPMIQAAKSAAPKDSRVQFNFEKLTHDIQAIQAGIAQQINHVVLTPRVVKPLQTDFIGAEVAPNLPSSNEISGTQDE